MDADITRAIELAKEIIQRKQVYGPAGLLRLDSLERIINLLEVLVKEVERLRASNG